MQAKHQELEEKDQEALTATSDFDERMKKEFEDVS